MAALSYGMKMHQDAFDEIKNRLLKPLVLHIPDNGSRFQLFLYTNRTAIGLVL